MQSITHNSNSNSNNSNSRDGISPVQKPLLRHCAEAIRPRTARTGVDSCISDGTAVGFTFAEGSPQPADYLRLAQHIEDRPDYLGDKKHDHSGQGHSTERYLLHPALVQQADTVVAALRRMADKPDAEASRRAYHTLRLLVP